MPQEQRGRVDNLVTLEGTEREGVPDHRFVAMLVLIAFMETMKPSKFVAMSGQQKNGYSP